MVVRHDRRSFGRRQTHVLAWIRVDGRPKLQCTIRNVTPVGAFLELASPAWLPFKFVLEVESDGTVFGCEIRHTRPTGIGVKFVPPEVVAEYKAKSNDARTDAQHWHGIGRQPTPVAAEPTPEKADGKSVASRIRASISSKR